MIIPIFSDLNFNLDEDGYPTEETLNKIQEFSDYKNLTNFFAAIKNIWCFNTCAFSGPLKEPPDDIKPFLWLESKADYYTLATVGRSGNEAIIAAMQKNSIIHAFSWVLSARGGLHVYQVKAFN